MIPKKGGSVLFPMPGSPDKDKGAQKHSAAVAIRSLGKGVGKTNHI